MNKKLTLIISSLFLVQIAVYLFTHYKEDVIHQEVKIWQGNYKPDYNGKLDLSNQSFSKLPKGVLRYKNELKHIKLDKNNFQEFPYELLTMPNLEIIEIRDNYIQTIDLSNVAIQNKTLKQLSISQNSLTSIKGLARLINLKELYASYNRIEVFPMLPNNLEDADLRYNKITNLDLKNIPKSLKSLNLNRNNISSIKMTKSTDNQLVSLYLNSNLIDSIHVTNNNISPVLERLSLYKNPLNYFEFEHDKLKNMNIVSENIETKLKLDFSDSLDFVSMNFETFNGNINYLSKKNLPEINIFSDTLGHETLRKLTNEKFINTKLDILRYSEN